MTLSSFGKVFGKAERLTPLDVANLALDTGTTPMHVGGVCVLEPPGEGFDYDRLV